MFSGIEEMTPAIGHRQIDSQPSPRISDVEQRWSGSTFDYRKMSISSETSEGSSTPITTPTTSPVIPAKEKRFSISGNSAYLDGRSKEDEMLDMTGVRM